MSEHTMTTDTQSRPTFTCTAPRTAPCHIYADCMTIDGCESRDENCQHAEVEHDACLLAGWYDEPADTGAMHLDLVEQESDTTPPANVSGPIEIEWDECPLWSFETSVYLEQAEVRAAVHAAAASSVFTRGEVSFAVDELTAAGVPNRAILDGALDGTLALATAGGGSPAAAARTMASALEQLNVGAEGVTP